MNEKYIKRLIRLVEESEIESLEVSHWGRSVKITQRLNHASNGHLAASTTVTPADTVPIARATTPPTPAEAVPAETVRAEETPPASDKSKLVPIVSPMVGTFYAAPAPDADPYVSLNAKVRVSQVVCIVEAMKLMNEIESEFNGRVAEILVENGSPVEFGQKLFLIDPE